MKIRVCYFAFVFTVLIGAFCVDALAQDRPVWQGAVSFRDGTVIKTGVGIVPAGSVDIGTVNAGVIVGHTAADDIAALPFIRTLRLPDRRVVVYEVRVKPLEDRRRFEVTLRAKSPTAQQAKDWNIDLGRVEAANFLSNYPQPLTINNGDTLAIEVLVNARTGARLVDYFLVFDGPVSDGPALREQNSGVAAVHPRPLSISDIELSIFRFEVRRDAQSIFKSEGGMRGRFIWLEVPGVGRFILTLEPSAEANGFESSAYVSGQRIVFSYGGNRYEIATKEPIIPASGTFSLWLRCDPTFSYPAINPFNKSYDHFGVGAADDLGFTKKGE
jgi:hypothetical protein